MTDTDETVFDVEEWLVQLDSGELGPLDVQAVRDLVSAGTAAGMTPVRRTSDMEWSRLEQLIPDWNDLAPRPDVARFGRPSLAQTIYLAAVFLVLGGLCAAWQWHDAQVHLLPAGTYVDVGWASGMAYRMDGPPPHVLRFGNIDRTGLIGKLGVLPDPDTVYLVDQARVSYATFVRTWFDSEVATVVVGPDSRLISIEAPVHSPSEIWSRRLY